MDGLSERINCTVYEWALIRWGESTSTLNIVPVGSSETRYAYQPDYLTSHSMRLYHNIHLSENLESETRTQFRIAPSGKLRNFRSQRSIPI
jgi:hypothetical protein